MPSYKGLDDEEFTTEFRKVIDQAHAANRECHNNQLRKRELNATIRALTNDVPGEFSILWQETVESVEQVLKDLVDKARLDSITSKENDLIWKQWRAEEQRRETARAHERKLKFNDELKDAELRRLRLEAAKQHCPCRCTCQ